MKERSKLFLILVLELVSRNATNAFLSTATRRLRVAPTTTRVEKKDPSSRHRFGPSSPTQLNFDLAFLEPITSLQDTATSLFPQLVQQATQTLFVPPAETLSATRLVQMVGEASFAGMFAIAGVQGALVMKQYQNNPNGGLVVPPGLTVGIEDATNTDANNQFLGFVEPMTDYSFEVNRKAPAMTNAEIEALVCHTEDTELSCAMKKQWYHITTQVLAVALVPLAALAGPSLGLAAWMMRYGHIMHLAVMFGLTHVYDFFRKLPTMETIPVNGSNQNQSTSVQDTQPIFTGDQPRIMVLGDSMSVGIGTCEVFDDQKVYDIPLHKEEHLASTDEEVNTSTAPGPLFPKVLAQTLSQRFQKPVAWRSAGVDGGSTVDIAEHLLDAVQDEVNKGQAPDLVVVLTGSNDLKHLLDGSASVKGFRSNLMELAQQIRAMSPQTRVVFPALPTYRMDQKSILNVFPLSVFLGSLMGVWDAQKMTVADQCPQIMHVDLKVSDVNSWYHVDDGEEPVSLIAADGIHPNARCYAKWGAFVGNSLADQILEESVAPQPNFVMKPQHQANPILSNHYGGGFRIPTAFGAVKQQQHQ